MQWSLMNELHGLTCEINRHGKRLLHVALVLQTSPNSSDADVRPLAAVARV